MRRRTWFAIGVSAFVVLALAAGYLIWQSGLSHRRSIGSGVVAEGNHLTSKLHAAVADNVTLPYNNPDLITQVGKVYQIGPSGKLPGLTSFTLPFAQKVTVGDDELLLAVTAESPTDTWTPVLKLDANGDMTAQPAFTLAADGMSAKIQVNHLSLYTFIKVKIGRVAALVKNVAGKVVGGIKDVLDMVAQSFDSLTANLFAHAKAPTCDNTNQALADQYQFVPDKGKDTLLTCFGMQDNQRIVQATDNRTYPLLLHHPGYTVVDDGPSFRMRLPQLAKLVSGPDTVLFPGENAKFGVDLQPGGSATLSTEFNGTAQNLYSLETALRLALLFLTNLGAGTGVAAGGGKIVDTMPVVDQLDTALNVADCGSLFKDNKNLDFGEVLNRCASPEALLIMFGKKGLLLAPIMVVAPVIAYFKSQFNAIGDMFNARDRMNVTVTRADTSVLCKGGVCNALAQGDVDGDGKLDEVAISIDTTYQDSREYVVTAQLATGKVVSGTLNFNDVGPMLLDSEWQLSNLSFVGFSNINGLPGDEIVAKMQFTSHDHFWADGPYTSWAISMLTYPGDGDELVIPNVAAGDFPMYTYEAGIGDWHAQGFRCTKAGNGSPLLDMWTVFVTDNSSNGIHEYEVDHTYYEPDAPAAPYNWRPADNKPDDVQKGIPLTSRAAPKNKIKELSNTGCPGLPRLPLPTYYWG